MAIAMDNHLAVSDSKVLDNAMLPSENDNPNNAKT